MATLSKQTFLNIPALFAFYIFCTGNAAAQAAQTDYTKLEAQIRKMKADIVGQSRVQLQGGPVCLQQECNLGNLVCDAMVHCALNLPSRPFDFHVHAIWHAGAFFDDTVQPGSQISRFDIHRWLPYHNRAHLVRVKGQNLKRLFDASAKALHSNYAEKLLIGQFLQVSNGLEVYYKPESGTISRIRMTHDHNGVPKMSDMLEQLDYYLVIPTYLYDGRGLYGFAGEEGFWRNVIFDNVTQSNFAFDDDCVEQYVRSLGQVSVGFEERIWINENPNGSEQCGNAAYTAETVICKLRNIS